MSATKAVYIGCKTCSAGLHEMCAFANHLHQHLECYNATKQSGDRAQCFLTLRLDDVLPAQLHSLAASVSGTLFSWLPSEHQLGLALCLPTLNRIVV